MSDLTLLTILLGLFGLLVLWLGWLVGKLEARVRELESVAQRIEGGKRE